MQRQVCHTQFLTRQGGFLLVFKLNSTLRTTPLGPWLITVALIGAGLLALRPLRADLPTILNHPILALELGILIGALVAVALCIGLPPQFTRIGERVTQGALAIWLGVLGYRIFEKPAALWGACHSGATCSASISLVTVVTAVAFLLASQRTKIARPTSPQLFLMVSAFALTAFELLCASANPLHVVLFHVLPTACSLVILLTLFNWTIPKK